MFPYLILLLRRVLLTRIPKILVGILFLLVPTSLFCQQSDVSTPTDPRTMQLLLERISQLEASQRQMSERLAQLEKAQPAGDPKPEARNEKLAVDQTGHTTEAAALLSPQSSSSKAISSDPKESAVADPERQDEMSEHMDVSKTLLNIRGFGDFGLYGGTQKGQTTSFSIGQINLFITSNLSERFKFLTELVFEVQQDNTFQAVPERVLLEWSLNDHFKLAAGRYHTGIGYYNTAYHHATWFQTATERPYVFEYEDEGGILPIHIVGLEASGQIPSGKLGLNYVAQVGNGRSRDPLVEPVQNYVDDNSRKAVNFALFARPDSIPGLQAGFSAYHDVLSTITSPRIDETIMDAYAVMIRSKFEWLNEALMIRHAPSGQHVFDTPAFYSQISERFGKYRPYLRYQYINASSQEPVLPQVGLRTGPSVGIRFDPTASVALKLQYDHTLLRRQPGIDGQTCPQLQMCAPNAVGVQVDFKF